MRGGEQSGAYLYVNFPVDSRPAAEHPAVSRIDKDWGAFLDAKEWNDIHYAATHPSEAGDPMLMIPDSMRPPKEVNMARLVDNFGDDHGEIIEVSSKDSGDPNTRAYDVYTDTTVLVTAEPQTPLELVINLFEKAGCDILREQDDYGQEDYECIQVKMPARDDERWFSVTVDKNAH